MRSLAGACLLFLVVISVNGGSPPEEIPHLELGITLQCSLVPTKYCTPDLGCQLDKNGGKCITTKNAPPLNCTQAMITSGGAVADAAKELKVNFKALGDINWMSMKNTSKAMDDVSDASSKYDDNVKKYNDSLVTFTKAEALLASLEAQLDAMQQTCAGDTPPPTCAADIAKLQMKISTQNATCAMNWIKVDSAKQFMDLSKGLVDTAETTLKTMMTKASSTYTDLQTMLTGFMEEKDLAIAFWTVVKDACTGAPPAVPIPPKQPHESSSLRIPPQQSNQLIA